MPYDRLLARTVGQVLSPVSIQTQSLAVRALRKRKPQETQALAFLAVFVYTTHATQAIAFEWKPGFSTESCKCSRRSAPGARLCSVMQIKPNYVTVKHIVSLSIVDSTRF